MAVYENNQTTLVDHWVGSSEVIPNTETRVDFEVSSTNEYLITDGTNRFIIFYFELVSGWVGTETIKVYSQDGKLTYIQLGSTAAGVFVPFSDPKYMAALTNYAATPFDAAVTITNTSAMTVTSYFGHAYSRTFTSTGTITHTFIGTNATAGNEIFMETTATGLPARVWPAGYVFGYAGAISSNAPSATPWAQMSVQKTPMGSIVWCVTGQVWQAGTP
jgi:hypothetical protein